MKYFLQEVKFSAKLEYMTQNQKKLLFKTAVFIFSLSLAWWMVKSGFLSNFVSAVMPVKFIAEFTAGIFYTSFLTAPISFAMLIVLAGENNPVFTALVAGLGAVLGDLLIVKFFREKFLSDIKVFSKQLPLEGLGSFLKKLKLEYLTPLIGAVIIASPFPDEIGLMMLGVSHLSYRQIAVLTYFLNTAGILVITASVNLLI